MNKIIVNLSEEDRAKTHFPGWLFDLCHKNDVFIEDLKTGELVQVLDLGDCRKSMNDKPVCLS